MRIKKTGKERFLEIFENVNKIKINEKKIVVKENKEIVNEWGIKVKQSRVNENVVDESFDNPVEKDHEYLNKGNILNVPKQTKPDDGTRYPVESNLKVKDPSLEKMKGDDAPIVGDKSNMFEYSDKPVTVAPQAQKFKDQGYAASNAPVVEDNDEEVGSEIELELGDEPSVDDAGVEPENDDTEMAGFEDDTVGNELEGGKGDDAAPTDFDPLQISKGIKVELEHTNDPKVALEIVLDHLTEDPNYYGEGGLDPDAAAMTSAQDDVHSSSYGDDVVDAECGGDPTPEMLGMGTEEPEGDEESDILFGRMGTVGKDGIDSMPEDLVFDFTPHQVGEDFDFAGQERDYYDNKYEEEDETRKQELLAKGEMASPEEKEELAQLLGLGQENNTQLGNENGFGNIAPSDSVQIGETGGMYSGPDIPLKGDGKTNFDTQSGAVNQAVEDARKRGYEVRDEDISNSKFFEGWVGYDNNRSDVIPLYMNGKLQRKGLVISLYRKDNGLYELTSYIN